MAEIHSQLIFLLGRNDQEVFTCHECTVSGLLQRCGGHFEAEIIMGHLGGKTKTKMAVSLFYQSFFVLSWVKVSDVPFLVVKMTRFKGQYQLF